jgi:hypothetical protein
MTGVIAVVRAELDARVRLYETDGLIQPPVTGRGLPEKSGTPIPRGIVAVGRGKMRDRRVDGNDKIH